MSLPLIGLSGSIEHNDKGFINLDYMNALLDCGVIPVLLSPSMNNAQVHKTLLKLSGVMLCGGVDVSPSAYGEDAIPELGEVCVLRDQIEEKLVKECKSIRMPLFGICRGIQAINVFCGGTLWQDLPSQRNTSVTHQQSPTPGNISTHEVSVAENSLLHHIVQQDALMVNSFHHQAVKETAPGFHACAFAVDGLCEAIESDNPDWFCLGVQWHPERMTDRYPAKALFRAFSEACEQYELNR